MRTATHANRYRDTRWAAVQQVVDRDRTGGSPPVVAERDLRGLRVARALPWCRGMKRNLAPLNAQGVLSTSQLARVRGGDNKEITAIMEDPTLSHEDRALLVIGAITRAVESATKSSTPQ